MTQNVSLEPAVRIEEVAARGFRNLAPLDFRPGERFNVISGENGAGKSNLLEALVYLATLRSFRGAKSEDLIANLRQSLGIAGLDGS